MQSKTKHQLSFQELQSSAHQLYSAAECYLDLRMNIKVATVENTKTLQKHIQDSKSSSMTSKTVLLRFSTYKAHSQYNNRMKTMTSSQNSTILCIMRSKLRRMLAMNDGYIHKWVSSLIFLRLFHGSSQRLRFNRNNVEPKPKFIKTRGRIRD